MKACLFLIGVALVVLGGIALVNTYLLVSMLAK